MFNSLRQAVNAVNTNFQVPTTPASPQSLANGVPRSNSGSLEERLRAKLAAKAGTSVNGGPKATGSQSTVENTRVDSVENSLTRLQIRSTPPLSPTLVPLPPSPTLEPSAPSLAAATDSNVNSLPASQPDRRDAAEDASEIDTIHIEVSALPPSDSLSCEAQMISIEKLTSPDSEMVDVESLQRRLKLIEQRFADVTESYKRLRAEKTTVDAVLSDVAPTEQLDNPETLRDFLTNLQSKNEIAHDEVTRLTGKLTRQEERIEELRDTHRLESSSQSDQIEKLKGRLSETEALLSVSPPEDHTMKYQAEISRVQLELKKSQESGKEEEEKRTKAINLLKSVRQKLVKAEKERDDAIKEISENKAKDVAQREKHNADRTKLQKDLETAISERDKVVNALCSQHEKEVDDLKEKAEKDLNQSQNRFETEMRTLKAIHATELSAKQTKISSLEQTINNLSKEKASLFDRLQQRQAELETSQLETQSLQSQHVEVVFQLKEAQDQVAMQTEQLHDARRDQEIAPRLPTATQQDLIAKLADAEARYERTVHELRQSLTAMEKERNETESDWSRKLSAKTTENEQLTRDLSAAARDHSERQRFVQLHEEDINRLLAESKSLQEELMQAKRRAEKVAEIEDAAKECIKESELRIAVIEKQLEECQSREAQTRSNNKSLRDELRKVQSSAALLERQRNPGIGYWSTRSESSSNLDSRTSTSPVSFETLNQAGSPSGRNSTPSNDEEINLEYLRNVILQFLEHKEMRPSLVKVISIILHFTPQETRRLTAKI